jgi:hypothetical protein
MAVLRVGSHTLLLLDKVGYCQGPLDQACALGERIVAIVSECAIVVTCWILSCMPFGYSFRFAQPQGLKGLEFVGNSTTTTWSTTWRATCRHVGRQTQGT